MIKKYDFKLSSQEETLAFGEKLGHKLFKGAVITLEGDLGAGKTTFTKGIAKGLGVTSTVNSPTFTIIKEYDGDLPLYHIDAYRLDDASEDLGLDEYFYGEGVTVIEWSSKIPDQIPEERLHICVYDMGGSSRVMEFFPSSSRYKTLCEAILNE